MLKLEWNPVCACEKARDFAYNFVELWNDETWLDMNNWDEALWEELYNNDLLYYEDQWDILREYCTPQDANWDTALNYYLEDIYSCISEVEEEEEEIC